ncbi:uncharacterized protein DNG_01350 [Cephalotrichum gorgonifer]|uniref:Mei2-like C-terminal RNA recognition motif domain-containing protein n=1 Tax=Cephalotrichum gorgonifer TaxID=2041049 RepID=A0AAE8MQR6_9PEZI|nr:uncharacterized protein DNG_01350 [Cephalotrichum gorgonifer]
MADPSQDEGGSPASTPASPLPKPVVPGDATGGLSIGRLAEKSSSQTQDIPETLASRGRDTPPAPDSFLAVARQTSRKLSPTASPFQPFLNAALGLLYTVPPDLSRSSALPHILSNSQNLSSDLGLSRHLVFTPVTGNIVVGDVERFLENLSNVGFQYLGGSTVQAVGNSVSAYFTDIRDSCLVYTNSHMFGADWDVKYVSGMAAPGTPGRGNLVPESQLAVVASILPGIELDHRRAEMVVYQLLHSQAQIFSIGEQSSFQNGTYRAMVEYCDVSATHAAATRLANTVIEIMLRNIPNKVDQAMLKRIIDESSWGKYDFMYLRIDFANDCNVGYAFINFVDPLDIIDFVNARGNQRWNCFKSDKVAEISYATIQGKDCLVQKFRNSSVMLEAPHYRPKVIPSHIYT